eukprot:jgi/Psemu1/68471/estExt_Genemark1.C_5090023
MNHHEEMNTNMHHMHHVHHGASDSEMPMNMPMHGSEHVLYSNGNSNGNGNSNPFCDDSGGTGGGMVMYMEGFRWTLLAETSDGEQPRSCLNLYVASWTLDTRYKFCAAMALVVVLGIATEGLGRWKHEVARQQHQQHHQQQQQHTRRARRNLYWKHACLQTLSILSAYLLMLVVMTYSLELFACVLLGLTIGYWLFGGETYRHGGGGTLCCGFLEPDDDGGGGGASVGNNSNNNSNHNEGLGGESPSLSPLLTERLLPDVIDDGNHGSGSGGSSGYGYGTTENHGHPCCNNNDDDDDDDGGDVEVVASPNENGQEGII